MSDDVTMDDVGVALTAPLELPPGIYRNMSMADYSALPYANASRLKLLELSPAHADAREDEDDKDDDPDWAVFGTAAHSAILEPDLFESAYLCAPTSDKRLKAWKDAEKECPPGVTLLRKRDFTNALKVRDAVFAHPGARLILDAVTDTELTIVWDDPETGVRCKARVDGVASSLGAIVEIKTAKTAAISAWPKTVLDLKYYRAAAHYLKGANQVISFGDDAMFWRHITIAIEKKPPFAVNTFSLRGDALFQGEQELTPLLKLWAGCKSTGVWPCESSEYSRIIEEISLPDWSWRKLDERNAA